jgi:biotin transport system substrate-specific component
MYPVPMTMQTFFVLTSGLMLGPKYGPLSQALYVAMGLSGLPVFAGGTGGLHRVLSPSFGFLVGFIAASWIAGLLTFPKQVDGPRTTLQYSLACCAATAALYAVALPCFYLNMRYITGTPISIDRMFEVALIPFVIPDAIKAVAAGALARQAIPMLRDAGLLFHQDAA